MRIGFFTYGINGSRMTGIARYTVELTRALRQLAPSLEIILLNPYPQSRHPWYQEFEIHPLPSLRLLPNAATIGNIILHQAAIKLKLDILHDPCGIAPFLIPTKQYKRITTVHDVIPFIYPETQPLLTRLIFRTLVQTAKHTADAVLTVSEASAADLSSYIGIRKDKLFAIPNGVTVLPTPKNEDILHLMNRLNIRKPYFLYVGALHPRKNLARVVSAFDNLLQQSTNTQLVIVGPPSWGANETLSRILSRTRKSNAVIFTNFISDSDLQGLYLSAVALVFPSLYEGFGLPALEAMAYGTPVLTSNVSSLPEVVGNAAVLVDPTSTMEITKGMENLLRSPQLRKKLIRLGMARAASFTWTATAQQTLAVYQRLCGSVNT